MSTVSPTALADEVKKLEAEEAAAATKAERAAEGLPAAPRQAASSGSTPPAQPDVRAVLAQVLALPAEKFTPMLIVGMDLGVRRLAEWRGGEEARAKYALRDDERALLAQVWTPIVHHYLSQLDVHPLVAAVGVTGLVYGLKALPEGGLEAMLGGSGEKSVPRAEVPVPPGRPLTTAELIQQPASEPAPVPAVDPVLALAQKKADELKSTREKKEAKA